MPFLRVSDDVHKELQLRAVALNDTPDSTLRRVLGIEENPKKGHGVTLFQLLVMYIEQRDEKYMREIQDRFRASGWAKTPNMQTPQQLAAGRRRSEAAMRAVATKRKKYKTWPTRKNDHK